ncbi:hypothetical protein ACFLTP_08905 [Chloroflexota bacterium]
MVMGLEQDLELGWVMVQQMGQDLVLSVADNQPLVLLAMPID